MQYYFDTIDEAQVVASKRNKDVFTMPNGRYLVGTEKQALNYCPKYAPFSKIT